MDASSPRLDAAELATEVASLLESHTRAFAPRVPPPDIRPMFTTHTDGSVYDRSGKQLRGPTPPGE